MIDDKITTASGEMGGVDAPPMLFSSPPTPKRGSREWVVWVALVVVVIVALVTLLLSYREITNLTNTCNVFWQDQIEKVYPASERTPGVFTFLNWSALTEGGGNVS